jgi:hypothetical protein
MTIQDYVAALNVKFAGTAYHFSTDKPGAKYTRVVQNSVGSRSVFCFIDGDGNIFKPASWKTPAKGIRATLTTLDLARVDQYGGWLYR